MFTHSTVNGRLDCFEFLTITYAIKDSSGHTTQHQENKQPNQKTGRRPTQTFLQRRHTDGQQAHERMPNITNY